MDIETRVDRIGARTLAIELITRQILSELLQQHPNADAILETAKSKTLRLLADLESVRDDPKEKDMAQDMHTAVSGFLALIKSDLTP